MKLGVHGTVSKKLATLTLTLILQPVLVSATSPEAPIEQPGEPLLESLEWLVGHWQGREGGTRSEEIWTAADGGVMLALHRDVNARGSAFFEYLRIVEGEDGLVYVAQPLGRLPTEFPLREIAERRVVFENPEHDFPQRIVYRLDAEGALVVRVEGDVSGEVRSSEWRWSRID